MLEKIEGERMWDSGKKKPVRKKGTGWEVSSGVEPLYEVLQTSA